VEFTRQTARHAGQQPAVRDVEDPDEAHAQRQHPPTAP
jgi:hypothetical protein